MRVLAIGECMAELAPAERPDDYRLGFAGDTFNTAWYLAMLSPDVEVSYFTAVGDDALSARMVQVISDSGIDTRHIRRLPGKSVGLYMIALKNGERSFSYWRGQSAARSLAGDAQALAAAIAEADLVYVSGITLAILEQGGRETLLQALRSARSAGKSVAFDPNLRVHLWSTPTEMTEAIMRAAACCDIALPSFEDEARWFGDEDAKATLERYARAGASTVIVKNGPEPVLYREDGTDDITMVPRLTSVIDTTAAGDSFNAAVFAGLSAALPLSSSIEQACRLAGQVVQGKGALVPVGLDLLDQFA
ncbi:MULTISPECIES: sugar kinase [unclassified Mameliella]|uniref:sugar kinase n=1 Tax=unclassified Mameliella TaxID=2630630 RepID=UPI00273D7E6E|nr:MULTISPECIES: sugar kinase [unclassified Mameliella]